jgi:hypothetical protein
MGQAAKKSAWRALSASGALAAFLGLQPGCVAADPAAKVDLPTVVQGETELELGGGYQVWHGNAANRERQLVGEVAYGFTSWWKSELAVGGTRFPGRSTHLDEIEWENIFALTEPGQYWLDLGLFAELARDYGAGGNAVTIGPMLQKELGPAQANLNVFYVRQLGGQGGQGSEYNYAWQAKWRGNPRFEPGLQGFGTLAATGALASGPAHKLGPAFFSQAAVGGRNKVKFDAALLFGLNRNTADRTVRFTLEYEIY